VVSQVVVAYPGFSFDAAIAEGGRQGWDACRINSGGRHWRSVLLR
jgi:hypothetical protein